MSPPDSTFLPVVSPHTAPGVVAAAGGAHRINRAIIVATILAAAVAGTAFTQGHEAAEAAALAGPDLVRLLRAMAALKAMMALSAGAAILWRLGAPAGSGRLAAYAIACAAMAAGPGLIWGMVHVAAGALLLHGGLAAAVLLLWWDPATAALLSARLQKRAPTYY